MFVLVVFFFIMDSLFSYCSASETFENTIDIVSSLEKQDKTSASMMGGELYERSTPNIRNEMLELKQLNQQLLEQLDDRQKLLDHTKSQLSFYRGNIETLEDEYTRMNKALTSAENEIAEYKVLVAKHEATIASLKNDLESFYDLEKRQNLSITDEKLSFSDEISVSYFFFDKILQLIFVYIFRHQTTAIVRERRKAMVLINRDPETR